MKNVVITGSTRGIGFGLAAAFLASGCQVVVNGRSQHSVDEACAQLAAQYDSKRIHGCAAVVSDRAEVQALWDFAVVRMGQVDIWVNNAGLGHDSVPFWELPPEQSQEVVNVNVLGLLHGSHVAMQGMLAQGQGQIYNMEGFGSGGSTRQGMSVYGTSKAAVAYFSKALVKEAKGTGVIVGTLQPGMVMTNLVLDRFQEKPAELERVKGIFNIIADRVENVAPWLVQKMLTNTKHGAHFNYAPNSKLVGRFLTAPFSRRDVFSPKK